MTHDGGAAHLRRTRRLRHRVQRHPHSLRALPHRDPGRRARQRARQPGDQRAHAVRAASRSTGRSSSSSASATRDGHAGRRSAARSSRPYEGGVQHGARGRRHRRLRAPTRRRHRDAHRLVAAARRRTASRILLVDAATGRPVSARLRLHHRARPRPGRHDRLRAAPVTAGQVTGAVRAYLMVDTYPAATRDAHHPGTVMSLWSLQGYPRASEYERPRVASGFRCLLRRVFHHLRRRPGHGSEAVGYPTPCCRRASATTPNGKACWESR